MRELEAMIAEAQQWREFHADQYRKGIKGASIEAAACAIRENALRGARAAILRSASGDR